MLEAITMNILNNTTISGEMLCLPLGLVENGKVPFKLPEAHVPVETAEGLKNGIR